MHIKMSESTSVVTSRDRDCIGCRLVSGTGLIGAGLYIGYHTKNFNKTVGKSIMIFLAGTSIGLGITRVLDLPPFRDQFHKH